jgi:hypothetical protein
VSPFATAAFLIAFKMIHGLAETYYKQLVDVPTEIIDIYSDIVYHLRYIFKDVTPSLYKQ